MYYTIDLRRKRCHSFDCKQKLRAHVATVHEEGAVPAQPLCGQVKQLRLWDHHVVQVERPLQVGPECYL